MARFYEKLTKPTALADGDIFVISVGSGTSWIDYKITYSQLKDVIKTISDMQNYYTKSQTYTKTETDNAIAAAVSSTYKFAGSKTCAELVSSLLVAANKGNVYNMTDSGTTTSDFVEGAGHEINVGDNVGIAEVSAGVYKFDLLSGLIDLTGYQTKNLASAIEGQTTVEGALAALSANKANLSEVYTKTQINDDFVKKSATAGLLKNDGSVDTNTYVPAVTGKGLSTEDYTSLEKSKLAGISDGATKTESSLTNGHIEIDDVDVTVYDDTALDSRVDVVEQDLSTSTATVEGNPLNFTTLTAQKANETVISLEPIQDLHGYDYPWPGGGGKNKIPESWEQGGVGSNTITVATYNEKKGESSTRIRLESLVILDTYETYTLSCASGYKYVARPYDSNGLTVYPEVSPFSNVWHTEPITFTGTDAVAIMIAKSDDAAIVPSEFVSAKIQLELGSTATDFAPYSNYCPIDGRTETSLVGCGVNEFDIFEFAKDYQTVGESKVGRLLLYLKGNTNYTISTNIPLASANSSASVFAWKGGITYETPNTSTNGVSNGISRTITTFSGGALTIGLYIDETTFGNVTYEDVLDGTYFVKIEEGPQATPYIESNRLTIQFGEKVYGATVELEKGTVTVDREIADMGDLTWSYNSTALRFDATGLPADSVSYGSSVLPNAICSIYKGVIWSGNGSNPSGSDKAFMFDAKFLRIRDTAYTSASTFKTAVTGQKLCYKLAAPRTIHLTPNEISLLKGVNNISTDGDSISLTYRDGKVATLGDLEGLTKKIADCEDVEITNLQASDVLVWDATAGKWKNQANTSAVHYDDTERVIGTWFGETLYQKSFMSSFIVHSGGGYQADISFDFSNIDKVVHSKVQMMTNSISTSIPYYAGASDFVYYWINKTENKIYIRAATNRSGYISYITIQYTKTTPTLLMQSTPTEESTPADESESTDENR